MKGYTNKIEYISTTNGCRDLKMTSIIARTILYYHVFRQTRVHLLATKIQLNLLEHKLQFSVNITLFIHFIQYSQKIIIIKKV